MATLTETPAKYLKSALPAKAKVILVNPPVQEKRYHWLRWNQPLDLLRLSTWFKENLGSAEVRLFDFMFPEEPRRCAPHAALEPWSDPQGEELQPCGPPTSCFARAS